MLLLMSAAMLAFVSCDKEEKITEQYPGEKVIENTVWMTPSGAEISAYLIFGTYDQGCLVQVRKEGAAMTERITKYVYKPEAGTVDITLNDKDATETEVQKYFGSISEDGILLEWEYEGEKSSALLPYLCTRDQVVSGIIPKEN